MLQKVTRLDIVPKAEETSDDGGAHEGEPALHPTHLYKSIHVFGYDFTLHLLRPPDLKVY